MEEIVMMMFSPTSLFEMVADISVTLIYYFMWVLIGWAAITIAWDLIGTGVVSLGAKSIRYLTSLTKRMSS